MKAARHLLLALLMGTIAACASGPTPTGLTDSGCGIAAWNKEWVTRHVTDMSWTGACTSGLAEGHGRHVVRLRDGRSVTYVGEMSQGMISGNGSLTHESGTRQEGSFLYGNLTMGKVYRPDGRLQFDGLMAHGERLYASDINYKDQRYGRGTLYFNDEADSRIEDGRFKLLAGVWEGIGSIDPRTGVGIIWGTYVRNGAVVYRMVEGRMYPDTISYMNAQTARMKEDEQELNERSRAFLEQQRARDRAEMQRMLGYLGATVDIAARSRAAGAAPAAGPGTAAQPVANTRAPERAELQISQLQLPGVRMLPGCIGLNWIDAKTVPKTVEAAGRSNVVRWPASMLSHDYLVATNQCTMDIVLFSAACMMDVLLHNHRSLQPTHSFAAGDLHRVELLLTSEGSPGGWVVLRPGRGSVVATRGLTRVPDRGPNYQARIDPYQLVWAAWSAADMTPGLFMVLNDHIAAVDETFNAFVLGRDRVRGRPLSKQSNPSLNRSPGVSDASCGAIDLRGAWNP